MQETGRHVANLVVAETKEDERPVRFKVDTCMADFLEWLDTLTEKDTGNVTVIADSFQGYDGYFVVEEYHRQNRIVEQVRNRGKFMQVTFDKIRAFPICLTRHVKESSVRRSNPRATVLYA